MFIELSAKKVRPATLLNVQGAKLNNRGSNVTKVYIVVLFVLFCENDICHLEMWEIAQEGKENYKQQTPPITGTLFCVQCSHTSVHSRL